MSQSCSCCDYLARTSVPVPEQNLFFPSASWSKPCHFSRLPREIRDQIYDLVLTIKPDEHGEVRLLKDRWCIRPSALALLETCRTIHKEAEEIFYKMNHLHIMNRHRMDIAPRVAAFCRQLTAVRMLAIEKLTVTFTFWKDVPTGLRAMRGLGRLKTLRLIIEDLGVIREGTSWYPLCLEKKGVLDAVSSLPPSVKIIKVSTVGLPKEKTVSPRRRFIDILCRQIRMLLAQRETQEHRIRERLLTG